MLNLHANKAVVMIKWWRGVLALLPTPTKEHFCQNPWVGEALSLCHEARYCINLARLQSLTEHVIGNIQIFFPQSLFTQHCFALMTLQENELYLSTSRYFSYPDLEGEQFTPVLSGQGRVHSFCFRNERDSQTRAHWQQKPQSFKSTTVWTKAQIQ